MLKQFLKRLLGLETPQPFPPLLDEKTTSNSIQKKIELPEDVSFADWGNDKELQRTINKEDSMAWEKIEVEQAGKEEALSPENLELLNQKGMDLVKALELKKHWSKGKSISETVSFFNGKRGYSQRTIAEYFSLFSKTQK